ncbi:MAG: PhnD/SsuA/transferrin family substrate-binding protein [Cyanobacteria bacterium P01_C01_bin.73]
MRAALAIFSAVAAGWVGVGCTPSAPVSTERLTIGVVSYGESEVSLEKYQRLEDYLAEQTQTAFELEVAYNELQATEQITRNNWSLVFASPGIAAIATRQGYSPLFPLAGQGNAQHALIIVRADSEIKTLGQLQDKVVALGEPGSAAGYYLPLYDLYGLTLQAARFAATPKQVLQWISDGEADAGAIADVDYERYKAEFEASSFQILHKSRAIPVGMVLMGPVERSRGELITRLLQEAPADIISDARYVPSAPLPDYDGFIEIVNKIAPLEDRVRQSPAILTLENQPAEAEETE